MAETRRYKIPRARVLEEDGLLLEGQESVGSCTHLSRATVSVAGRRRGSRDSFGGGRGGFPCVFPTHVHECHIFF